MLTMLERCTICSCVLHREKGTYARPDPKGRSHATEHHFVSERFFGRSTNRRGTKREGVFEVCPWGHEGQTALFCYECHEELLHNPVLLPENISGFAEVVKLRGFAEEVKGQDRSKLAGRVKLFQEVIAKGLAVVHAETKQNAN